MKFTVKIVLGAACLVLALVSSGLVSVLCAFGSGALLDSLISDKMSASLKAKLAEVLDKEI